MARPNQMYQAIKKLLEDNGPMPQVKIAERLSQYKSSSIASCVRQARGLRPGYEHTKTMYIQGYDAHIGLAGLPSPIVALGDLPCAPMPDVRPELSKRGRWTRWNAKVSKRRAAVRIAKRAADIVFQNMASPPKIRQDKKTLKELPTRRHELVDDEVLV